VSGIDEKYVLEAARQAGLPIEPARLPAVPGNLQFKARPAQPADDDELAPEDELGPEWKP